MFDSHTHYDDKAYDQDRTNVLDNIQSEGVNYIVNAGANTRSSIETVKLAEKYPFFYAAVGVHPHDAAKTQKNYLSILRDLANSKKVIAIGEIGLDYHYDFSPRELQKEFFIEQINLAKDLGLPIIVHDRDAHEDTISILKSQDISQISGVIHCFSGSSEMAKEVIKLGMYIGIGGTVTFSNAKKTVEVVQRTPIEYLLSETDCPYLSPVPFRGQRNDSRYMKHVIEKIAEIKGLSFEETDGILTENAKRLFKINL